MFARTTSRDNLYGINSWVFFRCISNTLKNKLKLLINDQDMDFGEFVSCIRQHMDKPSPCFCMHDMPVFYRHCSEGGRQPPEVKKESIDPTMQILAVGWGDRLGRMAAAESVYEPGKEVVFTPPEELGNMIKVP